MLFCTVVDFPFSLFCQSLPHTFVFCFVFMVLAFVCKIEITADVTYLNFQAPCNIVLHLLFLHSHFQREYSCDKTLKILYVRNIFLSFIY